MDGGNFGAPPKPANRRPLPQARSAAVGYEIVFPKRPAAAGAVSALFGLLRGVWERGGETAGDAYAAGARVVLDRKEALEDLNAERRHRARAGSERPTLDAPAVQNDIKSGS